MPLEQFVKSVEGSLRAQSTTRRKLSTILRECGYKRRTRGLAQSLQEELERCGVFPRPHLTAPVLRGDTFITFSRDGYREYENDQGLIDSEKRLEQVLLKALRHIPELRDLRLKETQYVVPGTRRRVDVAFKDTRTGELVLCELKKDDGGYGPTAQLRTYLKLHEKNCPDVRVRGLLITGEETPVLHQLVDAARNADHQIDWFCYELQLKLHRQD
jgi:hypothetical protein